jgi:hypothetical protein
MGERNNNTPEYAAPAFTGRNVPIPEIAKATGKDASYLRIGLQQGFLTFGTAYKKPGSSIYNYYCPDKKVWEELGYFNPNPPKKRRTSRSDAN